MARQYKYAPQPGTQILTAFKIHLSKSGSPQRSIAVMSDPRYRQLIVVQMCLEFRGSLGRSLVRKDVRPVFEQSGDKLSREFRPICQVANAHDLECRLT